jgi:hypothetical protein
MLCHELKNTNPKLLKLDKYGFDSGIVIIGWPHLAASPVSNISKQKYVSIFLGFKKMFAVKIFILVAFVAGALSLPTGSQGEFVK